MSSQTGLDRRMCRGCLASTGTSGCPCCESRGFVLERCGVWLSPEQVKRWTDVLVRRGEP